ncbi:hypothetical protein EI94DRAFT_86525 [Lactarius quietus]|nr:hypothetical protein EI94DRAFT_86525 [Lactarius quietus]
MSAMHTASRHRSPTPTSPPQHQNAKRRREMRQVAGRGPRLIFRGYMWHVAGAWVQCERERVACEAETSRKAWLTRCRGAIAVKCTRMTKSVHGGRTCCFSFSPWAWGTANTARDKRDAMAVVVINDSRRTSEAQFTPREQGTGPHGGEISCGATCWRRLHPQSCRHEARY